MPACMTHTKGRLQPCCATLRGTQLKLVQGTVATLPSPILYVFTLFCQFLAPETDRSISLSSTTSLASIRIISKALWCVSFSPPSVCTCSDHLHPAFQMHMQSDHLRLPFPGSPHDENSHKLPDHLFGRFKVQHGEHRVQRHGAGQEHALGLRAARRYGLREPKGW